MRAIVVRLGAYGDVVQITPIFRELKKQGYHVTFYCKKYGKEVVQHDPNIDKFIVHDDSVKPEALDGYLTEFCKGYDRYINLGGVVEAGLLVLEGRKHFFLKHSERRAIYGHTNYSDALMERAGLEQRGQLPELYFTPLEHQIAKKWRKKRAGKFVILWSLSGSSYHKSYPYAEYVAQALYQHSNIEIITVGDALCEMLEWRNNRTHNYSGKWPIRKSMIMTKYADLVIGTETGILNAAAAYDTPKIVMLSHSSEDNLTKYWTNTINLRSNSECQPCHSLMYNLEACELEPGLGTPICMSRIHTKDVYLSIMKVYDQWRNHKCQSWKTSLLTRTLESLSEATA